MVSAYNERTKLNQNAEKNEEESVMRINRVKLVNYRCFKELELELHDSFTVLVGNNGSGKSTVLDGIALGLASYFVGMNGDSSRGIDRSDVRVETYAIGSRLERQPQYPAQIECSGELCGKKIDWSRSKNTEKGTTTYGDAVELTAIAKALADGIKNGDTSVELPVLAYYSTARLWAKKKEKRESVKLDLNSRFTGYLDCLDSMNNEKLMRRWLEQMTYIELQGGEEIPELTAVKQAILACYNASGNVGEMGKADKCAFDVKSGEIEITYTLSDGKKEIHALSEMSDGYRNMLSMVADIAYRMALLNPQFLGEVTKRTSGVVLIDEIDLHLHPAWQRHIVSVLKEIFPKVQFIVSTHAPSVISSVPKEEIVVLGNHQVRRAELPTYGKDANSILKTVMDVPERPDPVAEKLKDFYECLSRNDLEQARRIVDEIRQVLGEDDPEVVGAETALELEAMV